MDTNNDDDQRKPPAKRPPNNDDDQRKPPAKKPPAKTPAKPSRVAALLESDSSDDDEIKENLGYQSFQHRGAPIMPGWPPMAMPPMAPMAPMGFQNGMPNQAYGMLNQAHPFAARAQQLQRPASAPPSNPVTQFELDSDSSDSDTFHKPTKKKTPAKKKPIKKKSTVKRMRKTTEKAELNPNFSKDELFHLLEIVEERLPIGGNEWEAVAGIHNEDDRWPQRDWRDLKKKFQALNRKKVPNCPPEVEMAKRVSVLIISRSNCQNFNDTEDDDDDSNDGVANDGIANDGIANAGDPAETPITKKKTSWGSKRKGAPAQLVQSSGSRRRSASASAMESYIRLQQLQMEQRTEEHRVESEERRRREEANRVETEERRRREEADRQRRDDHMQIFMMALSGGINMIQRTFGRDEMGSHPGPSSSGPGDKDHPGPSSSRPDDNDQDSM
jgi:hypothetical protein